jgi:tRNA threonylcarbamoyl adenosine modification protein (Sua5/YciO/YrdC/YwlC family)
MQVFSSLNDAAVARLLLSGAVGVIPTDTVYGIVARAEDASAVAALYRAKHREGKPGTVIAADTAQLTALGILPEALQPVAHLWPASLSAIVPSSPALAYLDQGRGSLAVRIPANPHIQTLLQKTGPLLTSSANQPAEPPATDWQAAQDYFGETIDFYVDGGKIADKLPSTIIRLAKDGTIEVVRAGAVPVANI